MAACYDRCAQHDGCHAFTFISSRQMRPRRKISCWLKGPDYEQGVQVLPSIPGMPPATVSGVLKPKTVEHPPAAAPGAHCWCSSKRCVRLAHDARRCRSMLLLVPSYVGHMHYAFGSLLRSLLAHATDLGDASLRLVISDDERREFEAALHTHLVTASMLPSTCPRQLERHTFDVALLTVSEITRPYGVSVPRYRTRKHARMWKGWSKPSQNKFLFQSMKKLYAARYLQYSHALILDSEAIALQPFGFRELFDDYFGSPLVVTVSQGSEGLVGCCNILGLKPPLVGLEGVDRVPWGYFGWFWESDVVEELFAHVERLHGLSLYSVMRNSSKSSRCFETVLYSSFVYSRPHLRRHFHVVSALEIYKRFRILELPRVPPFELFTSPLDDLHHGSRWMNSSQRAYLSPDALSTAAKLAYASLVRMIRSLRLSFFRVPTRFGGFGERNEMPGRWYFQRLRRLVRACPTLRFSVCEPGIDVALAAL